MTHLLVVDDEVSILELIKNSLGKDGYLITVCQNLKKKHLPSGRKEKKRCWADPFSRLIYIHWWRF